MAETLTKPMGTAAASPQPTTTKTAEDFKWVTMDEMEKYEKQIGRRYVRRNHPEEAKEFFFKITGMHPYQPGGVVCSEDQNLYQFEVQKYYRNKFTEVTVRDEHQNQSKTKQNMQVDAHEDRNGRWVLVDKWGSFFMDTTQFQSEFAVDTE